MPYLCEFDSKEINKIKIYIKRWLPDNQKEYIREVPPDAMHPPMIGISDGTKSKEFSNAIDLSNFVSKLKHMAVEPCEISIPLDSRGEIANRLEALAAKILWKLV